MREFKLYIGKQLLTPRKAVKEKQKNKQKDIRHIENRQLTIRSQSIHSSDNIILNRLKTPVRRQKLSECHITICCLQQMQFGSKDKKQVVGKRMEKTHYTNINHRTAGMAILLPEINIYSFKEKRYQQKERGKFHNDKKANSSGSQSNYRCIHT